MENKKQNTNNIFQNIFLILLILFSLFIAYQILRKILGGSWTTEGIIIALLVTIIGFLFNQTIKLTRTETNLHNLQRSFSCLAHDFKEHIKKKKH
jgi:uncharacterized membrane protein (DUF485 family)